MTLDEINRTGIQPALQLLGIPSTPRSLVMLLAIGLQESRFTHRRQVNNGPAMGFWQFERGGGVRGVLRHPASKAKALALCAARSVEPAEGVVWAALQADDVLAAGFARLLLLTDPAPLPEISDAAGAWAYYERNWRPGKPHPQTWADLHQQAVGFVS